MSDFLKYHYKDENIKDTIIGFIDDIKSEGFDLKIRVSSNNDFLFSSKVSEKNSRFAAYGKGITEELSIASGLGEFIERSSFGLLTSYPYFYYSQYKKRDKIIFQNLFQNNILGIDRLELFANYRSTGMSCGNTFDEAFVQAFSEIFERTVQKNILTNKFRPSVIDINILKEYKIYELIKKLVEQYDTEIQVLDCFTKTNLPVVGMILINRSKNKYVLRFGCHPIFDIAVERCLTEAFQLNDFNSMFDHLGIDIVSDTDFNTNNLYDLFCNGYGKLPLSLITGFNGEDSNFNIFWNIHIPPSSSGDFRRFYEKIINEHKWDVYYRKANYEHSVAVQFIILSVNDMYKDLYPASLLKNKICSMIWKYNFENDVDSIYNIAQLMADNVFNQFRLDRKDSFYRSLGIYRNNRTNFEDELYCCLAASLILTDKRLDLQSIKMKDYDPGDPELYLRNIFTVINKNGEFNKNFKDEEYIFKNKAKLKL